MTQGGGGQYGNHFFLAHVYKKNYILSIEKNMREGAHLVNPQLYCQWWCCQSTPNVGRDCPTWGCFSSDSCAIVSHVTTDPLSWDVTWSRMETELHFRCISCPPNLFMPISPFLVSSDRPHYPNKFEFEFKLKLPKKNTIPN